MYIHERLAFTKLLLILPICLPAKEEKDGDKSVNTEVEKKARPQKKSKLSEEITLELLINDIVDPTADDLTSSKKKYSLIFIYFLFWFPGFLS